MSRVIVAVVAGVAVAASLSGCGSNGGDGGNPVTTSRPTTQVATTAAPSSPMTTLVPVTTTATTTTGFQDTCGSGNVIQHYRPEAAVAIVPGITTEDQCCAVCNRNSTCVAWQYAPWIQECQVVKHGDAWVGMIKADGYIFGTKRQNTCADCDYCGTDVTDVVDLHRHCNQCANGANWNQYPCFVPGACKCVSSTTASTTTLYRPSTTASNVTTTVPSNATTVPSNATTVAPSSAKTTAITAIQV